MRWRKLKKYIQEHPYLLDKTYKLSMEEAQKRIGEAHMPTFEETIRAAMRKSSLPASAWKPALRVIDRRKKERARRKVLIPITASLAAVTVFFSATPIGQTLAADAARLVARIFDGHIVVESMGSSGEIVIPQTEPEEALPPAPAENNVEQGEIAYASFAELYEKTGLNPIVVGYEGYTLKSITFYPDAPSGEQIAVIYQNEALGELVTQQIWNTNKSEHTIKEPYFEKSILKGKQSMYCCINEDQTPNLFKGMAILEKEKIVFRVGFAADAPADAVLGSLQYYK